MEELKQIREQLKIICTYVYGIPVESKNKKNKDTVENKQKMTNITLG